MNHFKSIFAIVISALTLVGAGCIGTPDGHSKMGMPVKDRIISRYPRTPEQVASAARVVLMRMGKISVDNSVDNSFKAKVDERDVWVKVTKVDDKRTECLVMARTDLGGDINLAAELDKQIALQLTVTP